MFLSQHGATDCQFIILQSVTNQGGLLNVNNSNKAIFTHPITLSGIPKFVSGLYNGGTYYNIGAVGYLDKTEVFFNASFTKQSGAWVITIGV